MIRVLSRGEKRTAILRRPVTHLYPLEISCVGTTEDKAGENTKNVNPAEPAAVLEDSRPDEGTQSQSKRPRRAAAEQAREWMQTILSD